jgi:hypothetical protein
MPSAHVVESVIGLAVVCSAAAFLLFFALIAEVGPVRATVITYVNPAVAAVVGVLLLNEHLTAGMLLGFALVLAGSVLATGRTPEAVAERCVDRFRIHSHELPPDALRAQHAATTHSRGRTRACGKPGGRGLSPQRPAPSPRGGAGRPSATTDARLLLLRRYAWRATGRPSIVQFSLAERA